MCSLSFTEWMLLFTAIGTIGIAIIALLVYKKLLPQEAVKSQLATVVKLAETIASAELPLYVFFKIKSTRKIDNMNMNLFFLSAISLSAKILKHDIIISKFQYEEYLEKVKAISLHPLLPNSISEPLFDLLTCGRDDKPNPKNWAEKNYYILGISDLSYILENSESLPFMSLSEFQKICLKVKNSIINWFESNGLSDINHLALMNTKNLEGFKEFLTKE